MSKIKITSILFEVNVIACDREYLVDMLLKTSLTVQEAIGLFGKNIVYNTYCSDGDIYKLEYPIEYALDIDDSVFANDRWCINIQQFLTLNGKMDL